MLRSSLSRAVVFAWALVFVFQTPLLGASPTPGPSGSPGTGPDVSTPATPTLAIPVAAAPIQIRQSGSPSTPDPSIALRRTFAASVTPKGITEIPSLRTAQTRTFANPDGTLTTEVYADKINYQDPSGAWKPVDLTLVPLASGPYDLGVRANDIVVRASDSNADAALAQVVLGGHSVSLRTFGYTSGGTSVSDTVSFAPTSDIGSVFARPTTEGLEFGASLASATQPSTIAFAINTGGLVPSMADDGKTILLVDPADPKNAKGTTVRIAAPVVSEGGHDEGSSDPVSVQLVAPGSSGAGSDLPAGAVSSLLPSEVLVVYRIDRKWLGDPARQYPVVLDPTISSQCVGAQSGCYNGSTGAMDDFIFDYNKASHPDGWTVVRVGYDNRNEPVAPQPYNRMRGMFYFPDYSLPDGAQVTSATLTTYVDQAFGSYQSKVLQLYPLNHSWGTNITSWNDMTLPSQGWDNTPVDSYTIPSNASYGTGTAVSIDATDIVREWATRRPQDWHQNWGFLMKFSGTESTSTPEITWRKYSSPTNGNRPKLVINYTIPKVAFDFDSALGSTYAPSNMTAGQVVKLPITVTNNGSGWTFNHYVSGSTDYFDVGYRWLDAKGNLVTCPSGTCTQHLSADVATGATSSLFALSVTPPATAGQYTLRLDLVHQLNGKALWVSDWAQPSKFYSRNKKVLTSDSTRWVGSSVVERDEFGINVVRGGGTNGGDLQTVDFGIAGSAGINLDNHNLHLAGDTGLGFDDLLPMSLTYGYDSANTYDCTGVLAACGWYTNWDERFINETGSGNFTYQDSSGNRYLVSTADDGEMSSGSPDQLERDRFTIFDDSTMGWGGTHPTLTTAQHYSGSYSLSITATNMGTEAGTPNSVDIARYQLFRLAVRSSSTGRPAIGFRLTDNKDGSAHWFFYTFGPSSWTVSGFPTKYISCTTQNAWCVVPSTENILSDARAAISGLSTDLIFTTVDLRGDGGAGTLYYDDLRFDVRSSTAVDDNTPAWTANSGNAAEYTADTYSGSYSVKVTPASIASSPDCVACTSIDLTTYPVLRWAWKKAGGTSVALVLYLKDQRNNATGVVTYYAGPVAPVGATNPIQVSQVVPDDWTLVQRNLIDDARQVLNFFDDADTAGSNGYAGSTAPVADGVTWTGYKFSAVDGTLALFDYMAVQSSPLSAGTSLSAGEDFVVTEASGVKHYYNLDGLLERIVDRDGNTIALDYSYNTSTTTGGASAYTLTAIHAAGESLGSYSRRIAVGSVASPPSNERGIKFTEVLGSTGSSTGREVDFFAATVAGTNVAAGDLVAMSPARNGASTCTASPSGCVGFSYWDATYHHLSSVYDPRYTTGNNYRHTVTWTSGSAGYPYAINDASTNTSLLYVASFDDTRATYLYQRPIWQDAAARAASTAYAADLSPEGNLRIAYIAKACSGQCSTTSTTWPAAPSTSEKLEVHTFDGLARVSAVTTYRCPGVSTAISGCTGSTALATTARQASNAAAKVDNFIDPLAGGEIAWSQTAEQYAASMRDSGGYNADLYRTFYRYDDHYQVTDTIAPTFDRTPDYRDSVLQTTSVTDLWRLDDTGSTAVDAVYSGRNGTLAGTITKSQSGALLQDSDTSMSFNGSNARITSSAGVSSSAYTLEAWVRLNTTTGQTGKGILGRWASGTGALLYLNGSGAFGLVHNGTYVQTSIKPTAGRWYHVAATWDGSVGKVFVDGQLAALGAASGATGAGANTFEIGSYSNGTSSTFINARIDEPAVYAAALDDNRIAAHYQAGLAMTLQDAETLYDGEGHPIQSDNNYQVNGGFESGMFGYEYGNGASVYVATSPTDGLVQDGFASLKITGSAYIRQDSQLVPGQTFRFQTGVRTDGGGSTRGTISVYYWSTASGSWATLTQIDYTSATWATKAWDFTLPLASDGRVRISFWNTAQTGTAYFDDTLLVTRWTATSYTGNGLPSDQRTFQPGSATAASYDSHSDYAANTYYPPIFATKTTENYVDGTWSSSTPDVDVWTTATYDRWGRITGTGDLDGMNTTTTYAANQTDVASTADGLTNTTSYLYDAAGNLTSSTAPAGEVTSTTYNLRHPLLTTAPDGTISSQVWNGYDEMTSSIANYVNGTPSGSSAIDDITTSYTYDAYGNQTRSIADDGTFGGAIKQQSDTTYDLLGNVVATTVHTGAGSGGTARTTTNHFATTTDQIAGGTSTAAKATAVQGPVVGWVSCGDGTSACTSASGIDMNGTAWSTTTVTSVATNSTALSVVDRNLAGQTVRTIANYAAGGGSTADQNVATSATFDVLGEPLSSTDAAGRRTSSIYDAVGRVTQISFSDTVRRQHLQAEDGLYRRRPGRSSQRSK